MKVLWQLHEMAQLYKRHLTFSVQRHEKVSGKNYMEFQLQDFL